MPNNNVNLEATISDTHIKTVADNGITYSIEALHFATFSTIAPTYNLDSPESWKSYIDTQLETKAKVQLIIDRNGTVYGPSIAASEETLGKIYLVAAGAAKAGSYVEWVTIETDHGKGSNPRYTYEWEKIGTTSVDLDAYAAKANVNAAFSSTRTTNTSGITATGTSGATAITITGGSQTAVGGATSITRNIDTTYAVTTINTNGLRFEGDPLSIPNGTLTVDRHYYTPGGSLTNGVDSKFYGHTHTASPTPVQAYTYLSEKDHGTASVVTEVATSLASICTGLTTSTTNVVYNFTVSAEGTLSFEKKSVVTGASLYSVSAIANITASAYETVLTDSTSSTVSALLPFTITGSGGSYDIRSGDDKHELFVFAGSPASTLWHTKSAHETEQDDLSVQHNTSGDPYTPDGKLLGFTVSHVHTITAGTLNSEQFPVTVSIPTHTHSITITGHTHAAGHVHNISFSTL